VSFIDEQKILKEIQDAEDATTRYATLSFVKRSLGRYSSAQLAKKGHPYSVQHPFPIDKIPYRDPGMINKQSGLFALSWQHSYPTLVGDSLISKSWNSAPYADDLFNGIPGLTIPRHLMDKSIPNVKYFREINLTKGIRNGFQP